MLFYLERWHLGPSDECESSLLAFIKIGQKLRSADWFERCIIFKLYLDGIRLYIQMRSFWENYLTNEKSLGLRAFSKVNLEEKKRKENFGEYKATIWLYMLTGMTREVHKCAS